MQNSRHLSLSSNGQEQVLTIPPDLSLSSTEVLVRKEGDRLIVEPIPRDSLLSLLKTLPELTETWPDIDEGLLPLDEITLS
ncbi:VapB protein (antitoxin to VapC) [Geitlerinema sp. FC II]|nr:VapB protein (antitoxin to VapC) [Geitlerinema sp. FC II]